MWPETLGSRGYLFEQSRRGPDTTRKQENPIPHPGGRVKGRQSWAFVLSLEPISGPKSARNGGSVWSSSQAWPFSPDSGRHACSASNLSTISARPRHTFSITCLVTHACHLSDPSCPPHNPGIRLDGHVPLPAAIRSISKSGWICPWNTVYPDQPLI